MKEGRPQGAARDHTEQVGPCNVTPIRPPQQHTEHVSPWLSRLAPLMRKPRDLELLAAHRRRVADGMARLAP